MIRTAVQAVISAASRTSALGTGGVAAGPYLPSGSRVVFSGDSIMAGNNSLVSGNIYSSLRELTLAHIIDPRFRLDTWISTDGPVGSLNGWNGSNAAVGGWAPSDILAAMTATIALNPALYIYSAGINGINTGITTQRDDIAAALTAMRTAYASVPIVFSNVRPTRAAGEGAGYPQATIQNLNDLLAALADPADRIHMVDMYAAYDQGDGYAADADLADNLHPNPLGSLKGAAVWLAAIQSIVQPGNVLIDTPGTSLIGGRATNDGTAGFVNTGVTGLISSSMSATLPSGGSAVASKEANSETGGSSQVFEVTPSGTGSSAYVEYAASANISTTSHREQWVRMWAEIELDDWEAWSVPNCYFSIGGGTASVTYGANIGAGFKWTRGAGRLWISTPPKFVPADATQFKPTIRLYYVPNGAVGTGIAKVRRFDTEIIADPTADYAA